MGFWDSVRRFLGVETKKFSREEAQKLFNEFAFFVKEKPELKTSDIEKFLRERKALGFVHLEDTLVDEFITGLPKLFIELCSTNKWERVKDIYWAFGIFLKDKERLNTRITNYISSLELDEVTLRCLCDVLPPVKCPEKESSASREYSTDVQLAFGPEAWEEETREVTQIVYQFVERELIIRTAIDKRKLKEILYQASYEAVTGGKVLQTFYDFKVDWSNISIDFPRFWKDLGRNNTYKAILIEYGWMVADLLSDNEKEIEAFNNGKKLKLFRERLLANKDLILQSSQGKEMLIDACLSTASSYAYSYQKLSKLSPTRTKQIQIVSIADDRSCSLCKKKDMKIIKRKKISENEIFKALPPFHVGCRCTFTVKHIF